jgi:DNA-binding MarR family transcriptional regulator
MTETPLLRPGEALRDLRALEALDEKPDITQRDLASRLGIAVGLANACLRKMARKGLVKIKRINSRNITYHLTPAGIAEKARLSLQFAETTIDYYRRAKALVSETLARLESGGVTRIAIVGATDVAEIVAICSHGYGMDVAAIVDSKQAVAGASILGIPVVSAEAMSPEGVEALILASVDEDQDSAALLKKVGADVLVVWPLEGRIVPNKEAVS